MRLVLLTTLWCFSAGLRVNVQPAKNVCGLVLGAFGSEAYVSKGDKVIEYISKLNVSKGWCPEDLELATLPIAYFTDVKGHRCPEGVQCFGEKDLAPWTLPVPSRSDSKISDHLGSWKYRFYHAQMLVSAPFDLALYLDIDAVPCSGEGISKMFKKMKNDNADVGSVIHTNRPCAMSLEQEIPVSYSLAKLTKSDETSILDCSMRAKAPPGADSKEWSMFPERNAGTILADLRKTRSLFVEFGKNVRLTAGHARGDQLAYRQTLFMHHHDFKEVVFSSKEVCRHNKLTCRDGCLVVHKPSAEKQLIAQRYIS